MRPLLVRAFRRRARDGRDNRGGGLGKERERDGHVCVPQLLALVNSPPPHVVRNPRANPPARGLSVRVPINKQVVVVGFPATPLLTGRTRICISAGHSREDLEYAVEKLEEVVDKCFMRYGRSAMGC